MSGIDIEGGIKAAARGDAMPRAAAGMMEVKGFLDNLGVFASPMTFGIFLGLIFLFSACVTPTVTVDFPSPAAVGLIPVTNTRRARRFRDAMASRLIFALLVPYVMISSGPRPKSAATSVMGRSFASCAIAISDGTVRVMMVVGIVCGFRNTQWRLLLSVPRSAVHPLRVSQPPSRRSGGRMPARCVCPDAEWGQDMARRFQ